MLKAADVLSQNVKFNVDLIAGAYGVEVRVLIRVGNDADFECVVGGLTNGQADAVDGYAALVYGKISPLCLGEVQWILEGVDIAAVGLFDVDTFCRFVHVSLNDVPVETVVDLHGALHVDLVSDLE